MYTPNEGMLYPKHIRKRKMTCNCHKLGMLLHGENIVAINDGRMTSNKVMDIAAAPKNKKRMLEVAKLLLCFRAKLLYIVKPR